ncbi:hypothetical protein J7I98_40590 [Streptomyces sp. ISL-98]|uniref:hypothetical protein n=1 Tax=Streptomyces sp. ISL-98 TaxID=2819192 RepID=UPI001BE50E82|nr:hypothetical protein [Streptomyces sp. ISL-98]MBT2511936.1 hypothetical protein [Streptomyces sp. ISL-98]
MSESSSAPRYAPGVLDERDLERIRGEADRATSRPCSSGLRPDGKLAEPLTQFSDDELAAVFPQLGDDELLASWPSSTGRDVDAALPAARRDLIGLSDRELAERGRHVDEAKRGAINAEANRRRLLAEVFPDGWLAADLSNVGNDVLGWAIRYARAEDVERIADELDRRYPPAQVPDTFHGAHTIEGRLADRAATAEAFGDVPDPDEWGHLADDHDPYAGMSATERWIAERTDAAEEQRTARTPASRSAKCIESTSTPCGWTPRTSCADTCSTARPRRQASPPSACGRGRRTSPTPEPRMISKRGGKTIRRLPLQSTQTRSPAYSAKPQKPLGSRAMRSRTSPRGRWCRCRAAEYVRMVNAGADAGRDHAPITSCPYGKGDPRQGW